MDLSFSVNLNLKPMAQGAFNKMIQGRDNLLSGSEYLSNKVDIVNEFLFGNSPKVLFTLSAIGTLAASQSNPNLLATAACSAFLSNAISESRSDGSDMSDVHDDALSQLKEKYPDCEDSGTLVKEHEGEFDEIKAKLRSKEESEEHFYNLAQTNLVMLVASKLIFDNNSLALGTLALTSSLRSFSCVSKQKVD